MTISSAASVSRGRARSTTFPLTFAASAALASRGPIERAISAAVVPFGNDFTVPSGRVTAISATVVSRIALQKAKGRESPRVLKNTVVIPPTDGRRWRDRTADLFRVKEALSQLS